MPLEPPFSPDAGIFNVSCGQPGSLSPDPFSYREHVPFSFLGQKSGPLVQLDQSNIAKALRDELSLPTLNKLHAYLWWCARPAPALPLHEQLMNNRRVVLTEQVRLHLTQPSKRFFVKPLPQYLLHHSFWTQYLCGNEELHRLAVGFLLSYAWIIRYESDLRLAKEIYLVPDNLLWKDWSRFVSSVLGYVNSQPDPNACVNKRYLYGEIILPGLNTIHRWAPETPGFRIYVTGYGQFSSFVRRNFEWMGLGFLYLVAVLTALQVCLATAQLKDNKAFNWASYVFSVFCILLAVIVIVFPFGRHALWLMWFRSGRMRRENRQAAVP